MKKFSPTHSVVRRNPDGSEDRIEVRESAKSWITAGRSQYDKKTGTLRSSWHFQYARLLLETIEKVQT